MIIVVTCLAASACAEKSIGLASVSQAPFQGWSCDRLSQEVARADSGVSEGQKNAIERVMITKGCIHPLAAETE
jgi:hypothetical protein